MNPLVVSRDLKIACLLGKRPRPTTVISDVIDRLRAVGAFVTVHVQKRDAPLPKELADSQLIVQRGLGLFELSAALRLENSGVRCCNRVVASIAVSDRAATMRRLADAGVPVPTTATAATWPDVLDSTNGQPIVVKSAGGIVGRGRMVLIADDGKLPSEPPFAGPYILQEFIPGDGQDYKIYVAGPRANGLLKLQAAQQSQEEFARPFQVDAKLTELAARVGSALDLEIYGVDVIHGPDGPAVVDVNPFPGFRGVHEGAKMIVEYLAEVAVSVSCSK